MLRREKLVLSFFALVFATIALGATINGQLKDALLENLSSDPTGQTGRVYYDTTHNYPKVYNGSTWLQLLDASAGLSNPMTTSGDIIVATAAGVATRVAVGATGAALVVKSGFPAWSTDIYDDTTNARIGVGTTAPDRPLEVWGQAGITSFTGLSSSRAAVVLKGGGANGDWEFLDFSGKPLQATSAAVRIGAQVNASGSVLAFGTSNSFVSGITNQALTIDKSGNVGINSTTPAKQLDVNGVSAFNGDAVNTANGSFYQKVTNGAVVANSSGAPFGGGGSMSNGQYYDIQLSSNANGQILLAVADGGNNGDLFYCDTGSLLICVRLASTGSAFAAGNGASGDRVFPVTPAGNSVVRLKNCTGGAGSISVGVVVGQLASVGAVTAGTCP